MLSWGAIFSLAWFMGGIGIAATSARAAETRQLAEVPMGSSQSARVDDATQSGPPEGTVETMSLASSAAYSGAATDRETPGPSSSTEQHPQLVLRRHWDAGLEIRAASFYDQRELMLHAQWLRHWPSGLKLGGFLTSLPQTVRRQIGSEKPKLHYYALGLTGEFDVFRSDVNLPCVTLGINLGQGWLMRRSTSSDAKSYQETDLYVTEPYMVVHVLHWLRLDWGLGVAYQRVQSTKQERVQGEDLTGMQGFISFRHQM